MKLPKKFKMLWFVNGVQAEDVFNVTNDGSMVSVCWDGMQGNPVSYSTRSIINNIENGVCKIIDCNGQDTEGNPLNFTKDDLKPFMRVVQRGNTIYIVAENQDGKFFVRDNHLWYSNPRSDLLGTYNVSHDVVEVYDTPEFGNKFLDLSAKGKLLWKRVEAPVKTEQQLKLEALEKTIADATAQIAELKKTV